MQLGVFFKTDDGSYSGRAFAFGFAQPVYLKLSPMKTSTGQEIFKVSVHDDKYGQQIGKAWSKVSKEGSPYLSIFIDSPVLPAPFYGRLVKEKNDDGYLLFWEREDKKPRPEARPVVRQALTV